MTLQEIKNQINRLHGYTTQKNHELLIFFNKMLQAQLNENDQSITAFLYSEYALELQKLRVKSGTLSPTVPLEYCDKAITLMKSLDLTSAEFQNIYELYLKRYEIHHLQKNLESANEDLLMALSYGAPEKHHSFGLIELGRNAHKMSADAKSISDLYLEKKYFDLSTKCFEEYFSRDTLTTAHLNSYLNALSLYSSTYFNYQKVNFQQKTCFVFNLFIMAPENLHLDRDENLKKFKFVLEQYLKDEKQNPADIQQEINVLIESINEKVLENYNKANISQPPSELNQPDDINKNYIKESTSENIINIEEHKSSTKEKEEFILSENSGYPNNTIHSQSYSSSPDNDNKDLNTASSDDESDNIKSTYGVG